MKTLLYLSTLCMVGSFLSCRAAMAGPATVDVTVNGSTVTLSQGIPTTVGGQGSGDAVPIDIGNIIIMNGTPTVSASFTVNGQALPLNMTYSTAGGVLQYAFGGDTSVSLGTLGQVTAHPYGGSVQVGGGIVRVPITASLTYAASPAPAPEPSSCAALGVGLTGLGLLVGRRRRQSL